MDREAWLGVAGSTELTERYIASEGNWERTHFWLKQVSVLDCVWRKSPFLGVRWWWDAWQVSENRCRLISANGRLGGGSCTSALSLHWCSSLFIDFMDKEGLLIECYFCRVFRLQGVRKHVFQWFPHSFFYRNELISVARALYLIFTSATLCFIW